MAIFYAHMVVRIEQLMGSFYVVFLNLLSIFSAQPFTMLQNKCALEAQKVAIGQSTVLR